MNRRNFLSMLSALPFVRGLSAPKPEPVIQREPPEIPAQGWPVEISIDGMPFRAQSISIEAELWEDHSPPWVRRGFTGRRDITVRGLEGWALPLRIGERMSLCVMKPEKFEFKHPCMLVSRRETIEDEGLLVTRLEFIAESRGSGA